jgi:hypothetical protein
MNKEPKTLQIHRFARIRHPLRALPAFCNTYAVLSSRWSQPTRRLAGPDHPAVVGFQNPATGLDLVFHAALVFVDEATENGAALDPVPGRCRRRGSRAGIGGVRGRGGVVVRCNAEHTRRGPTAGAFRRRSVPYGTVGRDGD